MKKAEKRFDIIDLAVVALAGSFLGSGGDLIHRSIEVGANVANGIWAAACGFLLVLLVIVVRPIIEGRLRGFPNREQDEG